MDGAFVVLCGLLAFSDGSVGDVPNSGDGIGNPGDAGVPREADAVVLAKAFEVVEGGLVEVLCSELGAGHLEVGGDDGFLVL